MKRLLLTLPFLLAVGGAQAADCGDVLIAEMNWPSASLLANIDKIILGAGYGCNASLVAGDLVPTLTTMAEKGKPDVVPENWIALLPDILKRGKEEGKIVSLGRSLPDGGQLGWWIPQYIVEKHPNLTSIPEVLKHPELFPAPEDKSKGGIYNGPEGWAGTLITAQYYKAYNAANSGFELVSTGTAAALDASLIKAYEQKVGWVGFYWSPTPLLGKYRMVKLSHAAPFNKEEWTRCNTVADCPNPVPNDWPSDIIETAVSGKFYAKGGPAIEYLRKRALHNDVVSEMLSWMTDNQGTGEQGAREFLRKHQEIWSGWVTPDAVERIRSSL
ncbi:ABC transporter substrate-binding protein [Microvirga vignae]|uniref:ABC transporter substrate-binding protein n=1 Tax=Microvirga vignae TaxID=1225564 RepID=A0A0H1R5L5_9HYPH|nr:glycine betaine ABC transporter substrate-binding protein [Microvirga vignae]KLK90319.1 ABC transporter substrate-binding protein [Microvirga vignae]